MFCPKCKCEYRDGFNFCADCNVELVEKLPSEEGKNEEYEYSEFVTIAETSDIAIIPIVKSILDCNNIKYFIKGETAKSIAVFNNIMEVQVLAEDAQDAKEYLKDLDIK